MVKPPIPGDRFCQCGG